MTGKIPGQGGLLPLPPALPSPGATVVSKSTPTPHTRASLEVLPLEVLNLVTGYLGKQARRALRQTSPVMKQRIDVLEADHHERAAQVDTLLRIPHAQRRLDDLVRIGLLPSSALTYNFSTRKRAVLLSDNVIRGLLLNRDNHVGVDLDAFSRISSDRMPKVIGGIAQITGLLKNIASDQKSRSGKQSTTPSKFIQSNVFANALHNEYRSPFQECLRQFNADRRRGGKPNLALVKQWARAIHPDIHRISSPPLPQEDGAKAIVGEGGLTSLFDAACSHVEIVEILMESGADFNIAKADGQTPLICATRESHRDTEKVMVALLRKNPEAVDHADEDGRTALHWAARCLRPRKVEILLGYHADVNICDDQKRNALHNTFVRAIKRDYEKDCVQTVRLLLKAGIDLFKEDDAGKLPIDYVRQHSPDRTALIQMITDEMKARRHDFADGTSRPSLHTPTSSDIAGTMVEPLTSFTSAPGIPPGQGDSTPAAETAAELAPRTHSELESLPIELKGIIAASVGGEGLAALGRTSRYMRRFTQLPANRSFIRTAKVDAYLRSTPHAARRLKDLVAMGLLPRSARDYDFDGRQLAVLLASNVIKGFELNCDIGVNVDPEAFFQAGGERMPPVIDGIVDPTWSGNAIFSNANLAEIQLDTGESVTILSRLVKSNVFANIWCDNSRSLFNECLEVFAAGKSTGNDLDLELAKHWAHVVHPDILGIKQRPDAAGMSAVIAKRDGNCLCTAVRTHKDIVAILLERGVDFNIPSTDGRLPLTAAMRMINDGTPALMHMLLQQGVQVDAVDSSMYTALHTAAMCGHAQIAALLIGHGADIRKRDPVGRNALHNAFAIVRGQATETERLELTRCLAGAGVDLFEEDAMHMRPIDYLHQLKATQSCDRIIAFVVAAMRAKRPGSV
ncbi:ankyrin repeat domain-containing protein [Imbroritus primus]|uniref:ankyrin repeat domain-containing protein n=1 Tax=Imbroritus primus TaxID=3058603 RepID=UPI0002696D3B